MDMINLDAELPAHLKDTFSGTNPFAAAGSAEGFKRLTTKLHSFYMEHGGMREEIGVDTLDVVILEANPNKSKVYYADGFEDGGFVKPTCYSNNGTTPAEHADSPQSKKCSICPNNQWGSRITDKGGKGKACSDSMRLCVANIDSVDDIMLLKVTSYALKTLGQYGAQLAKRGVDPKYVVTQLGFNSQGDFPSLTFKAVRFIEEEELKGIDELIKTERSTIDLITGTVDAPIDNVGGFAITPKKEVKAEKAPVKAEPKKVEPKPEVKAKAPEPKAASVEDYDDIEDALDNLDFDD